MGFFRKKQPDIRPERLIVGLGNPGPEYKATRHNVGFDLIENLAKVHGISLKKMEHQAQIGTGQIQGVPVALVKPLTFMNLSGQAVSSLAKKYGIAPSNVIIIADDLDLPLGQVRMRASGGSGGHNGHKSVIASLGTQAYPRIRIGIGKGDKATISHVLSKFHPDERVDIDRALSRSAEAVERWLSDTIENAMNWANTQAQS